MIKNKIVSRKNGEFGGQCDYDILDASGKQIGMIYPGLDHERWGPDFAVWRVTITEGDTVRTIIDRYKAVKFADCKRWAQDWREDQFRSNLKPWE